MTQSQKHSFTVSSLKLSIEEKEALHNIRLGHLLREGRMTHLNCVSIRQLIHLFMAGFSLLVWGFLCSFSSVVGASCEKKSG